MNTNRRTFLQWTAAGMSPSLLRHLRHPTLPKRPKVAAIFTEFRFRSHTYNILESFLSPYLFNGEMTDPGVDVVALYADQFPTDDMAREVAERFNIPLYDTIEQALCRGGSELSVDAVLSIGEHGDYPYNNRGQQMYPRKQFFDQSYAVMKRANRFIPFFNDKHLSYRWDWAAEMYQTARQHSMPLLAGSSVPLAQRIPALELPDGAVIEEAVSVHGGGLESYDFHAIEVLQSMVESRHGGEVGIESVQLLVGREYEKAKQDGLWSHDLAAAAMNAETRMDAKRQPMPRVSPKIDARLTRKFEPPQRPAGDYAIRIIYRDGLKATVLKLGSSANRWNFACRLKDQPQPKATAFFNSPWGNRGLFKALSHAIQYMFITGKEPYPAERTLISTGVTEAVMISHERNGARVATPHLAIAYPAIDWHSQREHGLSWKKLTVETPQPIPFLP